MALRDGLAIFEHRNAWNDVTARRWHMTHNQLSSQFAEKIATKPSSIDLPAKPEIGFVGLGRMGSAMAANLASAAYDVVAFVRRPEQRDKLAKLDVKATLNMA